MGAKKMTNKELIAVGADPTLSLVDSHVSRIRDSEGSRLQRYKRFKEGIDYAPIEPDAMVEQCKQAQFNMTEVKRIGQPPKYPTIADFVDGVNAYYEYLIEQTEKGVKLIPDIEGLCMFLGICRDTLRTWKTTRSPAYSATINVAYTQIMAIKKQLALTGKIPPMVFAIDANNNHGYTQKQEITVTPSQSLADSAAPRSEIAARYLAAIDAEVVEDDDCDF